MQKEEVNNPPEDYSILKGKKILYLPEFDLENDMVARWRHLWPSKYLHEKGLEYKIKGAMESIIYRPTKEEMEQNPNRYAVEIRSDMGFNNTDNRAQAHVLKNLKKEVDESDVVVFGRTNNLFASDIFDYAKSSGKVIGYEVDDLTFGKNGVFNKTLKPGDKSLGEYIGEHVKGADFVTVTTPYLKEEAAKLRGSLENIYIIKNRLDLESLGKEMNLTKKIQNPNEKLRIGWAGGKYHINKILELEDTFKKLNEKYKNKLTFVFKGFDEENMNSEKEKENFERLKDFFKKEKIDYEFHPYTKSGDWKQYYKELKSLGIDIFFAPLKNDPSHEAKSELKYLEASLIGAPIVVPAIGGHKYAVKNGETGILIYPEDQNKGFYEGISHLIDNPKERERISENAKKDLLENYDVRKSSEELSKIFSEQIQRKNKLEEIVKL